MKIKLKNNLIPLFGCIDLKKEPLKKFIVKDFIAKQCMVGDSYNHIDENELYSYIIFDNLEKSIVNSVFIGRVKYLGLFVELDYLYAYGFYPENEIKINCIGIDEDFETPNSVYIKQKKL